MAWTIHYLFYAGEYKVMAWTIHSEERSFSRWLKIEITGFLIIYEKNPKMISGNITGGKT
jgi:hypothetical protein